MPTSKLTPLAPGQTKLSDSPFRTRFTLNHKYVSSLSAENLLRPYRLEAGLWGYSGSAGTTIGGKTSDGPTTWHWGWESLTCELRGHILGHWLSGAAKIVAQTGDGQLRAKIDYIVGELARCQSANGGEWVGPFPERFLHRIERGEYVWAPQYTLHKLFMGLLDVHEALGITDALHIATRFAAWFVHWTALFDDAKMDDILDWETGGMLEIWAQLYAVTGDPAHRELVRKYDRRRLFDPLIAGEDVLTNKHANTQIPEVLGAARAFEATGAARYRKVVEAFWDQAVTKRGMYVTGGSSNGEIWQPPHHLSARLQAPHEHCTVYNMMRLAQVLYRWTGDNEYADYWERNYINAILAQQNPDTGMVSYFLPMEPGSKKMWGSPTDDFWCCHGSLMQAHPSLDQAIVLVGDGSVTVSQYLPSTTTVDLDGTTVTIAIKQDTQNGVSIGQVFSHDGHHAIQHVAPVIPATRPNAYVYDIAITSADEIPVRFRIPWWVCGSATVAVDGAATRGAAGDTVTIGRHWRGETVRIVFPTALTAVPIADQPDTFAFMDGPVVLAGLAAEDRALVGDPENPTAILTPDRERHHGWWLAGTYRTVGQAVGIRFLPLNEIRDEAYSVYFRVMPK